jgi:hypothetical protein
MSTVKEWLESCGCTDVLPIRVTIEKEEFEGCQYTQRGEQNRLYLLGNLPKVKHPTGRKHPKDHVCFTCEGKDWYVAYYMLKENLKPEFAEHHPFGPAFGVFQWNVPEPIDQYEKYKKYKMEIVKL